MRHGLLDIFGCLGPVATEGGRRHVADGHVSVLQAMSDGGTMFGVVRVGSKTWQVSARAAVGPGGAVRVSGECSCGQRPACSHLAGVLWKAVPPEARERDLRQYDDLILATSRTLALAPRYTGPPTTEDLEKATREHAVLEWLNRLSRTAKPAGPAPAPAPGSSVLLYVIGDWKLGMAGAGLSPSVAVHVATARILKRGGYGVLQRFHFEPSMPPPEFVTREDRRLVTSLRAASADPGWGYSSRFRIRPVEGSEILPGLLATGRCHWEDHLAPPLRQAEPARGVLEWRLENDGTQRPVLRIDRDSAILLPLEPPWYVDPRSYECGPVETGLPPEQLASFLAAPRLHPEQTSLVRRRIQAELATTAVPLPTEILVADAEEAGPPVPHLLLYVESTDPSGDLPAASYGAEFDAPMARLSFAYGDLRVGAGDPKPVLETLRDGKLVRVRRDLAAEARALGRLDEIGIYPPGDFDDFGPGLPRQSDFVVGVDAEDLEQYLLDLSFEEVPRLEAEGWHVAMDPDYPYRPVSEVGPWYADVRHSRGEEWFDLDLGVEIEGKRQSLLPVLLRTLRDPRTSLSAEQLAALPDDQRVLVPLDDGRVFPIPIARLRAILSTLIELYATDSLTKGHALRLSALQASSLAELEERTERDGLSWSGGETIRELGRKLRDFQGVTEVPVPAGFRGTLRDYQRRGLDWLQFLRDHELSGMLADDMGLGKTIQLLAHLLAEKESGRMDRPSLVVAPTSLMPNWRREAERFAPELRVLTLQGAQRRGRFGEIEGHDLVLTTYALLPRDADELRRTQFHCLILDEAQFIKNPKTKAAVIARELQARQRICSTGTPMENHLGELWSLFHVLAPGLLGDEKQFRRLFRTPIEKHGSNERRGQLVARIRPFLLRRTKEQVAAELPPKTEIVQVVDLEGDQRDLYESIRLAMHEKVRKEVARKGLAASAIVILDALLKLRQVCCDPRLLKLQAAAGVRESAKLDALLCLVEEVVAEGRRVLLFSQFTSMLALIEPELRQRGIAFVRITGDTRDRETPVRRFQAGEVPVFLISLRAGGTGLNLPAADTVIHYDPWWNPAVENQATDRAHRIGQDKPVFVYKLIAAGSVEEKIRALQARKSALTGGILGTETQIGQILTAEDLEGLFRPLE